MKAKFENGNIKIYTDLPNAYKGIENVQNGYALRTDLHEADGFFEVLIPDLQANEQRGAIYFDTQMNCFTYPIEPLVVVQPTPISEEQLRQEYSQRISDIPGMREAIEKFIILGETIPQIILDERIRLTEEFNIRLLEL